MYWLIGFCIIWFVVGGTLSLFFCTYLSEKLHVKDSFGDYLQYIYMGFAGVAIALWFLYDSKELIQEDEKLRKKVKEWAANGSPERIRVDTEFGYISFAINEVDKAFDYYMEEGIRVRYCRNIFDDGTVIAGPPILEDHSQNVGNYPKGTN